MSINYGLYQHVVEQITQRINAKVDGIKLHSCNVSGMTILLSHQSKLAIQMPNFIKIKRASESTSIVSAETEQFASLARIMQQLRDIAMKENLSIPILPYDAQFQAMLKAYQNGVDKNQILSTAIHYIYSIRSYFKRRGILVNMASKEELLKMYLTPQSSEFLELARLMDNIKKQYEKEGYIVNLLPYDEQVKIMQQEFEKGVSKQDVLLHALNKMEDAKSMLVRNGVTTKHFPEQESLEKYYIGSDKDYIELAKLCDEIYQIYHSHGLTSPTLPYHNQLHWMEAQEKKGINKESILKSVIDTIEYARVNLESRNIHHNFSSQEELFHRYAIQEDHDFVSLAQTIDKIRTFYLTHQLNTGLLPYESLLKVMKDASKNGISRTVIYTTMLKMIEDARIDLESKGYPITLPSKEELSKQYNVLDEITKGVK